MVDKCICGLQTKKNFNCKSEINILDLCSTVNILIFPYFPYIAYSFSLGAF